MVHGTGRGFDQGLLFAVKLRLCGFGIIAHSRFGFLGSAFSEDVLPAYQTDTLAELLNHLGFSQLPVTDGSAGALTAVEFSFRHSDRRTHLGLLVPAEILTDQDPVEFTAPQWLVVNTALGSDFWSGHCRT
ncbi:hypothetical protein [Leisingera sp. D0M16]|uniref:hypothetical protein n=1 Tax=Leisingera coralii TaxID=3351347 RepID=UPI003BA1DE77